MTTLDDLLAELETRPYVSLGIGDPLALLAEAGLGEATTVSEIFTGIGGKIRTLEIDGVILVQEETTEREVLVRRFETLEDAEAFVSDRMETYERMWDGCGCKVHYFE
jgi:hypothetical protein